MYKIKTIQDKTLQVKEISIGGKYGLDNCLINDSNDTLIEFYDNKTFISRYNKDTILTNWITHKPCISGLCLRGDDPSYNIDSIEMSKFRSYLIGPEIVGDYKLESGQYVVGELNQFNQINIVKEIYDEDNNYLEEIEIDFTRKDVENMLKMFY